MICLLFNHIIICLSQIGAEKKAIDQIASVKVLSVVRSLVLNGYVDATRLVLQVFLRPLRVVSI